jgi:hypothetical protein
MNRIQVSRQMSLLESAAPVANELNDAERRELVLALSELLLSAVADANHVSHGGQDVDEDYA